MGQASFHRNCGDLAIHEEIRSRIAAADDETIENTADMSLIVDVDRVGLLIEELGNLALRELEGPVVGEVCLETGSNYVPGVVDCRWGAKRKVGQAIEELHHTAFAVEKETARRAVIVVCRAYSADDHPVVVNVRCPTT